MNKAHVAVLIFLVLLSLSFARCAGEATIAVPAIVENDANLVSISVRLLPGYGDIYLTTAPHTGVSTQTSVYDAVTYAFIKSGRNVNECDALIKIWGKNVGGYVDGPSAGAALSVATYAALNNATIRNDVTITGAADVFGNVAPVGGLFEKAKAAIKNGKKYFMTPLNRIAEKTILRPLKEKYNLTVLEVSKVDEAIDFFIYGKEPPENDIKAMKRALPNVTSYNPEGLERFADVALAMINLENKTIRSLSESTSDEREIKQYFINEVERQVEIFKKGYLFTAANEAFLNYIDAGTIANAAGLDIEKKYEEVNNCLSGLKPAHKTTANFEYVIGSELREKWATTKLRGLNVSNFQLVEEKYYVFNELMYADAWCRVAAALSSVNVSGLGGPGALINESLWKELAEQKLISAEKMEMTSEESKDHLNNAKELFDEAAYGASIYETTFAVAMHNAETDMLGADVKKQIDELALQKRVSLWGRIYQTQGVFLSQGEEGEQRSAYKILRYALALDDATSQMKDAAFEDNEYELEQEDFAFSFLIRMSTAIVILLVLLLLLLLIFKNRRH